MKPVIRRAEESDLDFLHHHDHHPTAEALVRAVSDGRVLVLDDHGTLKGWLRWTLFWDEHPFLNMIYVLAEHRGIGFGSLLLDVWEREMKNSQYTRALISTAADERSQHLYRRRGYSDAGVLLLPGEVAELLFSKDLTLPAQDS
ncbi:MULTISPECIES: GNAT family N-acetyltransferase [Microbacterium]|uniref:GNAT family N-acetyltransferase n=1 Tax=Microbacterium TaxID=33882 RepID=UPI00051A4D29|nr:GNAT family N-acetyltransferase [Microbacterium profundi]